MCGRSAAVVYMVGVPACVSDVWMVLPATAGARSVYCCTSVLLAGTAAYRTRRWW